jgi:hypothetical protein
MHKIDNKKIESVTKGRAKDINDFFEQVVKPQFQHRDAIIKTHNALMKYAELGNRTMFLRLYGSFSKDKYGDLRRGFLTRYKNGIKMAFCDNTFAMYFAGLKLLGEAYTTEELKSFFDQKSLVTSFGTTAEERELMFYNPKGAPRANLNSKGWYLAHIKPVGYDFNGKSIKDYFPHPENRSEWNPEDRIRHIDELLEGERLNALTAHFLRLIHPMNSFLVPKRNFLDYEGKNIGEEIELIKYVQRYLISEFKSEYKEFDELSMPVKFDYEGDNIKDIKWFDTPQKVKSNSKNKSNKTKIETMEQISNEEQAAIDLDRKLQSIGKEVFVGILYPEILKNSNVGYSDIAARYERYASYSEDTQKSRLSTAKSIFRDGLQDEALQNIVDSKRLDESIRQKANDYIEKSKEN